MTNIKPVPQINQYNEAYFEAAKNDQLVLQHCQSCHKFIVYPRNICPTCLSYDHLEWKEVSGQGQLFSFAEVHRPQHEALLDEVPIFLAAVKLKEGPIMISRVVDCQSSDLEINIKLKVKGHAINDKISIPVFKPSE